MLIVECGSIEEHAHDRFEEEGAVGAHEQQVGDGSGFDRRQLPCLLRLGHRGEEQLTKALWSGITEFANDLQGVRRALAHLVSNDGEAHRVITERAVDAPHQAEKAFDGTGFLLRENADELAEDLQHFHAQDPAVELDFRTEVVVNHRQIHFSTLSDGAGRGRIESLLGEGIASGLEDTRPRTARLRGLKFRRNGRQTVLGRFG